MAGTGRTAVDRSAQARARRVDLMLLLMLVLMPGASALAQPSALVHESAAAAESSVDSPLSVATQPLSIAAPASSATNTGQPPGSPAGVSHAQTDRQPMLERPHGLAGRHYSSSALSHGSSELSAQLSQTALMLALVIGGFLLLAWLLKRIHMPRGMAHPMLKVLAAVSLGGKERVVVVQADEARLVLGVGATGVSFLYRLAEEQLPMGADGKVGPAEASKQHTQEFHQLFKAGRENP